MRKAKLRYQGHYCSIRDTPNTSIWIYQVHRSFAEQPRRKFMAFEDSALAPFLDTSEPLPIPRLRDGHQCRWRRTTPPYELRLSYEEKNSKQMPSCDCVKYAEQRHQKPLLDYEVMMGSLQPLPWRVQPSWPRHQDGQCHSS